MNLFQEAKSVLDKDGKVNALGPYGRQKLTGRELSTYFRRNKVKDAQIKKAVEVALDLGGADSIARKEIKKFYGDKILKSKEVQKALQYANEEVFKEDLNKEDAVLEENYRVLAKKGMGAETKNSIRVGHGVDYYRADGVKYSGKIIKMGPKSYIVKDDKNGKNYQFMYHDRVKAKQYLKQGDNIVEADAEKKAELALKQTREKEALAKKHEREKESIADSYRRMWEDAELSEEVANITVDPKNRINSGQQQAYHGMEIAKQARRFGLKSAVMHKHIRIKGPKKKVNDFLRLVIGKSTYGDPTEKDMSTPQVDKMLTKGLK